MPVRIAIADQTWRQRRIVTEDQYHYRYVKSQNAEVTSANVFKCLRKTSRGRGGKKGMFEDTKQGMAKGNFNGDRPRQAGVNTRNTSRSILPNCILRVSLPVLTSSCLQRRRTEFSVR